MVFRRLFGSKPYDWAFIRRWSVESIDLYLKHAQKDPEKYERLRDSRRLDRSRIMTSDSVIAEVAMWVMNMVENPAGYSRHHVNLLKRYKRALRGKRSPEETLQKFYEIER